MGCEGGFPAYFALLLQYNFFRKGLLNILDGWVASQYLELYIIMYHFGHNLFPLHIKILGKVSNKKNANIHILWISVLPPYPPLSTSAAVNNIQAKEFF